MRQLNDAQRAMVQENMGIAYQVAYRMVHQGVVPKTFTEDAVQEAMIGLMQAARAYEPERGWKFTTLAVICCRNKVRNIVAKENAQTRVQGMSMQEAAGSETMQLADQLAARDDTEAEAVSWTENDVYQMLEEAGRGHWAQLLIDNANGRPMEDIARERGVSRQAVCKQISRARVLLREAMACE